MTAHDGRTPVIALDVDGVLVVEHSPGNLPAHLIKHSYSGPGVGGAHVEGSVHIDPVLGEWITELLDLGADLVWCTSWNGVASTWLAPLFGLPADLPWIELHPTSSTTAWGWLLKGEPLRNYVGDRPLVWLDDNLGPKDLNWGRSRLAEEGVPALLIKPDPAVGLTREHVDDIATWLRALAEGK